MHLPKSKYEDYVLKNEFQGVTLDVQLWRGRDGFPLELYYDRKRDDYTDRYTYKVTIRNGNKKLNVKYYDSYENCVSNKSCLDTYMVEEILEYLAAVIEINSTTFPNYEEFCYKMKCTKDSDTRKSYKREIKLGDELSAVITKEWIDGFRAYLLLLPNR
jgi:hypothetical protein